VLLLRWQQHANKLFGRAIIINYDRGGVQNKTKYILTPLLGKKETFSLIFYSLTTVE
jgi:hypothetical protein